MSRRQSSRRPHVIRLSADDQTTGSVAEFIAEGLRFREHVVVVATRGRWTAVQAHLRARGHATIAAAPHVTYADARQVLAQMVVDGRVNRQRMKRWLSGLLARTPAERMYGEMVALLARDGKGPEALRLERLIDDLARARRVTVLCTINGRGVSRMPAPLLRELVSIHSAAEFADGAPPRGIPSGRTILIAEPFEDMREMFTHHLAFMGYTVVSAEDGLQAVEAARASAPDVILMDVEMPRISGAEATRILRRSGHLHNTPIIGITAHASESSRRSLLSQGFDDVLLKPCPPDVVEARVASLLRAQR